MLDARLEGKDPMTQSRSAVRLGPAALWVGLAGLFSAMSAPAPDAPALLASVGVPAGWAAPVAHLAPVVLMGLVVIATDVLASRLNKTARVIALGLAGGVVGFCTAFVLDAFAGLAPLAERLAGPIGAPGGVDVAAWGLFGVSIFCGLLVLVIGAFGTPAARAVQMTRTDADTMDVRPRERADYVLSGVGMVGQAVFLAALALAHQAQGPLSPAASITLTAIAATGAVVFSGSSILLWRRFDELMRRVVVDAYAVSAVIATIAAAVWAFAEVAGLAPPLSAYAATVALLGVQTVAAMWISTALAVMPSGQECAA